MKLAGRKPRSALRLLSEASAPGQPPTAAGSPGLGVRQPPRSATPASHDRSGVRDARRAARTDESPPRPRLRLGTHPTAAGADGVGVVDLRERQAGASLGHEEVDSRTHRLLAQCPQEARVVHGEAGEGCGLLGGLLQCGAHREEANPGRMETLPLGGATLPTIMSLLTEGLSRQSLKLSD